MCRLEFFHIFTGRRCHFFSINGIILVLFLSMLSDLTILSNFVNAVYLEKIKVVAGSLQAFISSFFAASNSDIIFIYKTGTSPACIVSICASANIPWCRRWNVAKEMIELLSRDMSSFLHCGRTLVINYNQ